MQYFFYIHKYNAHAHARTRAHTSGVANIICKDLWLHNSPHDQLFEDRDQVITACRISCAPARLEGKARLVISR